MGYIIRRLLLLFNPGFFSGFKKNKRGGRGVDEDDNGKYRLGRVNIPFLHINGKYFQFSEMQNEAS